MRIGDLNWMQVADYLKSDDRAVVPLGSTEQHAYLRLTVDAILSERVAADAAEPLGIPVFPVQAYGVTPYFSAYPGTITLRSKTYRLLLHDILDSLYSTGFRRILFVNGHGGNSPGKDMAGDWLIGHGDAQVRFHNWWRADQTMAFAETLHPSPSHANWFENFPWTRLADVSMPSEDKPVTDWSEIHSMDPEDARAALGDGSFGGAYQIPDDDMLRLWEVAVAETRALMTEGW